MCVSKWGEFFATSQHDSGIRLKRLTRELLLMVEEENRERLCVVMYVKLLKYCLKAIFPQQRIIIKVTCILSYPYLPKYF